MLYSIMRMPLFLTNNNNLKICRSHFIFNAQQFTISPGFSCSSHIIIIFWRHVKIDENQRRKKIIKWKKIPRVWYTWCLSSASIVDSTNTQSHLFNRLHFSSTNQLSSPFFFFLLLLSICYAVVAPVLFPSK